MRLLYNSSVKDNHLCKICSYHKSYQDWLINDHVFEFQQLYLIFGCLKYYSKDSGLVNVLRFCSQVFDVKLIDVDPFKVRKVRRYLIHIPL